MAVKRGLLQKTVLYVEDEPEIQVMVSRLIGMKFPDVTVLSAENGEAGLAMFREHRPDLVMTDIGMPVMNGIRMAEEIRRIDPDALIIAITAYSDTASLLDAINAGINNYLLKPIDHDKLFSAIGKSLGILELRREVETQRSHILQLSRAVEESPCAIVLTDRKGLITYTNPRFFEVSGYHSGEAVGRDLRLMMAEEMTSCTFDDLQAAIVSGEGWRGELPCRRRDGETAWVHASVSPIRDSRQEISHYVAVLEDVTQRKKAEEEIELLNTVLAERAEELETVNTDLESFNYSVSHDLRNPLTSITCRCQILMEICGPHLDEECQEHLRCINREAGVMKNMIETLVRFSRFGRAEIRWERVDLSELAEEIGCTLRMGEPARQVAMEIAPGVAANGDRMLLKVLMENLMGNAWKYTGARECGTISFGEAEIGGKRTFFVRDNGVGFDPAERERLFVPFHRLPSAAEFPGDGIGLATAEKIVRRHGGRIWAEGAPGEGATFYFTL